MATKIGIFKSERQATTAVQQLLQGGFAPGDIRVIAKDGYHSRALEAESGVHVDELNELVDTRERRADSDYDGGELRQGNLVGVSVAAMGSAAYGTAGYAGGMPYAAAAYYAATDMNGRDGSYDRALATLGVDDAKLSACREAVKDGSAIVVVSTSESKTLLEKDGGPELSTLGDAEAVFRSCGAAHIE